MGSGLEVRHDILFFVKFPHTNNRYFPHFLFRLGPLIWKTMEDFLFFRLSAFLLLLDFLATGFAPSTSMAVTRRQYACNENFHFLAQNLPSSFSAAASLGSSAGSGEASQYPRLRPSQFTDRKTDLHSSRYPSAVWAQLQWLIALRRGALHAQPQQAQRHFS